jgi:Do/DeqQ family serine protease
VPTDGTIADTAERVVDSVVNISVKHDAGGMGGTADDLEPFDAFDFGESRPRMQQAKGSGVIVTAGGRILTNAHVVNGFEDIKVTLQDGSEYDAKVIGKDTKADLAVIQLKGSVPPLKPIAFGDSSTLRLGDIVLAIGDGLGVGKSVSMGIVSAKGRGNMGIEEYEDFIQTDAAINPGNSGGALVNLKGELVGINTAIASKSGGYSGIGFAIPSTMARPIMDMLVHDGKVTRGYLGIGPETVGPALAKEEKLGASKGVLVAKLQPGGPAAKAHLVEGDVIVAIDGRAMNDRDVLRNTIAMTKPGTTIALQVVHRDGTKGEVKATLGTLSEEQPVAQQQGGATPPGMPNLGPGWHCQQRRNGWQCYSNRAP